MTDAWFATLQSRVGCATILDDRTCATDFGGLCERTPRVAVHAEIEDDVVNTFEVARESGLSVTIRGAGHSFLGQSLDDAIVICNGAPLAETSGERRRNAISRLLETLPALPTYDGFEPVLLSARYNWQAVQRQLSAARRTTPVLTNHLATTVGGTLSAGGYGLRSCRNGAQIDHVRAVRLVTMDGNGVWCTPDVNAELFELSLGGYGQVGAIEAVVLDTPTQEPWVALRRQFVNTLPALVDAANMVDGDVTHLVGEMTLDGIALTVGRLFADHERATAQRWGIVQPVDFFNAATPRYKKGYRQLWCDYGLSPQSARDLAAEIEAHLADPRLRQYLDRVYLLRVAPPSHGRPGPFDIRVTAAPHSIGLGLYFRLHPRNDEGLRRVQDLYRVLLPRVLELGGRPYLQGSHPLDANAMRALYPNSLRRIATTRSRFDPQALLNRNALPVL